MKGAIEKIVIKGTGSQRDNDDDLIDYSCLASGCALGVGYLGQHSRQLQKIRVSE
jgi:hypothetical protein